MTIEEAYRQVQAMVSADDYVCIELECWWHSWKGGRGKMEPQFLIHANHREMGSGKTLADAVASFELKNAERPVATSEDIARLVTEAEAR